MLNTNAFAEFNSKPKFLNLNCKSLALSEKVLNHLYLKSTYTYAQFLILYDLYLLIGTDLFMVFMVLDFVKL